TDAAKFLDHLESTSVLAISVVTLMELAVGCRNKTDQRDLSKFLRRFQVLSITADISDRAVELIEQYNLSHVLMIADTLIAATALTLGEPLATKNQRDYRFVPGLNLLQYPA